MRTRLPQRFLDSTADAPSIALASGIDAGVDVAASVHDGAVAWVKLNG
ncbi:hypothetical protein [Agromyces lapidis]|nr:hypothetical protein [Agromyces lapidis]